MSEPTLVVHGHFYQPPRENPWTEEVTREASAAPCHDWNERIDAECYRPNACARVVDDAGRVVAIVDNYSSMSWNVGPTLAAWLERRRPSTWRRIVEADGRSTSGIAQAFGHMILPLASERDRRTQVRWGLVDFEHRFGRPAEGMWLPECAVDDDVLAVLAEEGVRFTVLAPGQADGPVDVRRPHRWRHPTRPELGLDLVFYDGSLSHAVAFELSGMSSGAFCDRVTGAAPHGGLVVIATDGESFGHHHHFAERLLAHALTVEAPRRGLRTVASLGTLLREAPPSADDLVAVKRSAWSCAHGVGRWSEDCGCATGGLPGWNQRWREPLRAALDVLRDRGVEVFERRGGEVLDDPWAARDRYVRVLLGAVTVDEFLDAHLVRPGDAGDATVALTLLEAQRAAMAMYTSCGWFFNDLAGLETVQVLRYACLCADLLGELGEDPGLDAFLDILATAESNVPDEGDGRRIWERHVLPARVDASRAVAQLALQELLERRPPGARIASWDNELLRWERTDRGSLSLVTAEVALVHRRTRRRTEHAIAGLHLGGLEVLGAERPLDRQADPAAARTLHDGFVRGDRVTTLLRTLAAGFGDGEFDRSSALPDHGEELVARAAEDLSDRFALAYDRLYTTNRDLLDAVAAAGYPLPAALRAPAELALARRLEAEVLGQGGSLDPADYLGAINVAREARASGFDLDTPTARSGLERLLVAAVERAVGAPDVDERDEAAAAAGVLLDLSDELGLHPSTQRAQEIVYDALTKGVADAATVRLGERLHLAVDAVLGGDDG